MRSLLRMSDQELAKIEAGNSFGVAPAIGISATAMVLALAGMMLRYAPGDEVPINGMDHFGGQCSLAAMLGISMLVAAWLIRGVFMKRLQWAVLLSLLVHLFICLTLRTLVVQTPLVLAAEIGVNDVPLREMTLPDYGGAESDNSPSQQWERPTEVDISESDQQQLQRQDAEIQIQAEPDQVESPRQVENAEVPERQQQQQEMDRAEQLEMQRQLQQAQADTPERLETPEVETEQVEQPDLQARDMNRSESERQNARRQMENVESQNDPQVNAARIASRSEVRPQDTMELQAEQRRETAEARIADAMAEAVELAAATEAPQLNTEARNVDSQRQSQTDLPNRQQQDNSAPAASSQAQVSSVSPSRSEAASRMTSNVAPASGGAASLQRSATANGSSTTAANTSAQAVEVGSVGGTGAPNLTANAAASSVARGTSSVPTGAASGGGGAPSMRLSQFGISALQSGSVGRSRGTGSGPQLGEAVSSDASGGGTGRTGTGQNAPGAVGTQAQNVAVRGVGGGGGSSEQVLSSGPSSASSNVGRSSSGLPATQQGGAGVSGTALSGSSGRGTSLAMNAQGRAGLSGRATEPSARLGGSPGGGTSGRTTGNSRRSAGVALPAGALAAEEGGSLVVAGPQAPSGGGAGSGNLSGPRGTSVARRSAGLPGIGRGPTSVGRSRPRLPGSLGATGSPARSQPGARPRIASNSEVAAMIRRSVPGISPIPTERISAGFSMRTPEARVEAVGKLGGSEASESAVDRGLEWLAAHQFAAGNWSIHDMNCKDHDCTGNGSYQADPAATGLALLAFLGAGHTHKSGDYQQTVQRGLKWLTENQKPDGDLFAAETEFAWFYSHGIAAIALCEAYGMTKDQQLLQPAQKALDFIVASQHPKFGGWRYQPQFESDTSVSGWQLMALKSGEMAGLKIPKSAWQGVSTWLDSVEDTEAPGRFSYHPTKEVTPTMTAEGLLMRQYLGADRSNQNLIAGASYLQQRLPRADSRDVYYWYYATQVMFHMQGDHWTEWNATLRDLLTESQDKGGPERGSWDPEQPTKDTWGRSGGRHYVTCLNLLMLEVYYRHLPLYLELDN